MKKLIAIALCFCITPSWATWTFLHSANSTCGTGTCAITVTSTGSGNLLVATGGRGGSGAGSMTSPTNGCSASWTHDANALNSGAPGFEDIWYCLNSASGVTSITLNTAATFDHGTVSEYSTTSGPPLADVCSNRTGATATSQPGVTLTLTGTNDVIVQGASCAATITAVSPLAYHAPFAVPNGNGVAGSTNTASGTAPTWTEGSSNNNLSACAFMETTGGAVFPAAFINNPLQY